MPRIQACQLPEAALLHRYRGPDGYVDCYAVELPRPVAQAEYVEAFYTTAIFRLERWLLARFLRRPSSDQQARALALGQLEAFAAWTVEARAADQLLMCDMFGRTRSWLMSLPAVDGSSTRLCFGSAVVPVTDRRSGHRKLGFSYVALTPFHRLYSRLLLGAAAARLRRGA
jgi:hypothetical protein